MVRSATNNLSSEGIASPMRLGRTLSVDRSNPDDLAKEQSLTDHRSVIQTMRDSGGISELQYIEITNVVSRYVQFNGGRTLNGFNLGLSDLINNYLDEIQNNSSHLPR